MGEDEKLTEAITYHQLFLHCLELFFTDKIFILENHLQQSLAQGGPGVVVGGVSLGRGPGIDNGCLGHVR